MDLSHHLEPLIEIKQEKYNMDFHGTGSRHVLMQEALYPGLAGQIADMNQEALYRRGYKREAYPTSNPSSSMFKKARSKDGARMEAEMQMGRSEAELNLHRPPDAESLLGRADPGPHLGRSEPESLLGRSDPGPHLGRSEPESLLGRSEPGPHLGRPEPESLLGRSEPESLLGRPEPGPHLGRSEPESLLGRPEPGPHLGRSEPESHLGRSEPESHLNRPEVESNPNRPETESQQNRTEPESQINRSAVLLDWYNSDYGLMINQNDFLSAEPITEGQFSNTWHGVRGSSGFNKGKVFFEMKITDCLSVRHQEEDEQPMHGVRVGWTTGEPVIRLGEDPYSFVYDSTGKKADNLNFRDYAKPFGVGDVVGSFVSMENESLFISFTMNGERMGVAWKIPHKKRILFPYISTKNCSFKVNFGQEDPWSSPLKKYVNVGLISEADRILGGRKAVPQSTAGGESFFNRDYTLQSGNDGLHDAQRNMVWMPQQGKDADGRDFSFIPPHFLNQSSSSGAQCESESEPKEQEAEPDNERKGPRELDYFLLYYDDKVMDIVVNGTNSYQKSVTENPVIKPNSKKKPPKKAGKSHRVKWKPTDSHEMYKFLALTILMSHVQKYNLSAYWQRDSLIATPVFAKYISRDRYTFLLRYLHFSDSLEAPGGHSNDVLYKVREVITQLLNNFKSNLKGIQDVMIDQSLILFKGHLVIETYKSNKTRDFRVKLFVMCDRETGLVLDVIEFLETKEDIRSGNTLETPGAIVTTMMQRLLGEGHIVYLDNRYASPGLSERLLQHVHGDKDKKKKKPPKPIHMDSDAEEDANEEMHFVKWTDNSWSLLRTTEYQSTLHDMFQPDWHIDRNQKKLDVVLAYSENSKFKDEKDWDVQISKIDWIRKSADWHQKLFFRLVDITLWQAYNTYRLQIDKEMGKPMKYHQFSLAVAQQLLEKFGSLAATRSGPPLSDGPPDRLLAANYVSQHYLQQLPRKPDGNLQQKNCKVCRYTTRRPKVDKRRVTTWCASCGVGLCVGICFKDYHSLKNY